MEILTSYRRLRDYSSLSILYSLAAALPVRLRTSNKCSKQAHALDRVLFDCYHRIYSPCPLRRQGRGRSASGLCSCIADRICLSPTTPGVTGRSPSLIMVVLKCRFPARMSAQGARRAQRFSRIRYATDSYTTYAYHTHHPLSRCPPRPRGAGDSSFRRIRTPATLSSWLCATTSRAPTSSSTTTSPPRRRSAASFKTSWSAPPTSFSFRSPSAAAFARRRTCAACSWPARTRSPSIRRRWRTPTLSTTAPRVSAASARCSPWT